MQFFPSAAQVPSSHYKASPSARQAVEIPKLSLYGKAMLPLKPSHRAWEQLHHTTEHHFWDSLSAGLGERIYSWHIQKRALPKSFNVREALHMMEAAGIPGPLSPEPSVSQPVLWGGAEPATWIFPCTQSGLDLLRLFKDEAGDSLVSAQRYLPACHLKCLYLSHVCLEDYEEYRDLHWSRFGSVASSWIHQLRSLAPVTHLTKVNFQR